MQAVYAGSLYVKTTISVDVSKERPMYHYLTALMGALFNWWEDYSIDPEFNHASRSPGNFLIEDLPDKMPDKMPDKSVAAILKAVNDTSTISLVCS